MNVLSALLINIIITVSRFHKTHKIKYNKCTYLHVQYMSIKFHHTVTVITSVLLSVQYSNYCITTVVFN